MSDKKQVTVVLSEATFDTFEKRRLELGLSKNQMLKLCVLQSLGLADGSLRGAELEKSLRGK